MSQYIQQEFDFICRTRGIIFKKNISWSELYGFVEENEEVEKNLISKITHL